MFWICTSRVSWTCRTRALQYTHSLGQAQKVNQKPIPCYQSTKLGVNKIQVILPIQKKRDKRERKKKKKRMNDQTIQQEQ